MNTDQISSKTKVLSPREHFMSNANLEIVPISINAKINDDNTESVNENSYPMENNAPFPSELIPHNQIQGV